MNTIDGHTATLKPLLHMSQQPEGKHKKNDILQLMPQGNADDWEATGDLKHFKQNLIQLMGLTQENSTGTASSGGRGNKDRGRKETRWVDIYDIVIVGNMMPSFLLKILLTHLFFFDTCSFFFKIIFSRPERQEEGKDGEQDTSGVVPKARFRGTVCSLGSHGLLGKSNLQVHKQLTVLTSLDFFAAFYT